MSRTTGGAGTGADDEPGAGRGDGQGVDGRAGDGADLARTGFFRGWFPGARSHRQRGGELPPRIPAARTGPRDGRPVPTAQDVDPGSAGEQADGRAGPSVPTAPSTPYAPTGPSVPTVPSRRLSPDRTGSAGPVTVPHRGPRTEVLGEPSTVPGARPGPAEHRRRVMVLVGTRPELVKLSQVIVALERAADVCLVHSGQHYDYELSQVFFDELGIRKPDHFLDAVGASAAETIGRVIARADAVFADEAPDALLLYGDSNTTLAVIAARRRRIPVFHLEAGNRCFDDRVPEELNRRVVDHLSDINLALTEHARRNLLAEGVPAARIFVVGSPMNEVLTSYLPLIEASPALTTLGITPGHYLVVSAHRAENVDRPDLLAGLLETLNGLAARYRVPVIVSTHPRTRDRIEALESAGRAPVVDGLVRFCRPFGFADYIALQRSALCVVSDSGTLTEEASLLGFPAVMIREAHEHPEGIDGGVVVTCLPRPERVLAAVDLVTAEARANRSPRAVSDYAAPDVSVRVARIVVGYIDYVRRTVWFERPSDGAGESAPGDTPLAFP
ncbi:UDP-N-acetyl glucosamine 2-epimerase [Parafrankia colletiae]|uniref:UDP-N-acetyl glucosamine 2-epimerase n=1 Tax=Parafrankia colletiae TaxID=573497 RepID=A0A1S1RDG4_9ACTN|nr:UDP-N-acetylglucosamine 2-epimerase [Parafrankia colletiae]MCK9900863.1 UDP-N-acetylglucosamine 2-epimerase [Frankia sp. Cpl3]OHV43272.1 UDP-N-acetyl glucosamine 2-epimerase [Parafrankia colletiae]